MPVEALQKPLQRRERITMITKPAALVPGLVGVRGSLRVTYVGRTPKGQHLVSVCDVDGSNEHGASYALDTVMLTDSDVMAYIWGLPGDGIFYLDSVMAKGEPSPTESKNPRARQVNHYRRALDGGKVHRIASAASPVSPTTYRHAANTVVPIQKRAHTRSSPATYQRPALAKWNRRACRAARYWEG